MGIAKKASIDNYKLKVLIWGEPGCGKTRWSLNSPRPLVIDTEKSTELYSNEFDFYRATIDVNNKNASTFVNLTKSIIDEINANEYDNEVETLIVDSVTDVLDKIESNAANAYEKNVNKNVESLGARDKTKWYAFRKDQFRKCIDGILSVDKHIIMTARSKLEWGNTKDGFAPTGTKIDGHELLEYLVDIVIKLHKDGTVEITKTRLCKENGVIENIKTFNDLFTFITKKDKKELNNLVCKNFREKEKEAV